MDGTAAHCSATCRRNGGARPARPRRASRFGATARRAAPCALRSPRDDHARVRAAHRRDVELPFSRNPSSAQRAPVSERRARHVGPTAASCCLWPSHGRTRELAGAANVLTRPDGRGGADAPSTSSRTGSTRSSAPTGEGPDRNRGAVSRADGRRGLDGVSRRGDQAVRAGAAGRGLRPRHVGDRLDGDRAEGEDTGREMSARITYCDRKGVAYFLPLGVMNLARPDVLDLPDVRLRPRGLRDRAPDAEERSSRVVSYTAGRCGGF